MKFSKKNKEKFFSFELENEPQDNFGKQGFTHPDVLTADEILHEKKSDVSNNSALDSLLKRMTGETVDEIPEQSELQKSDAEEVSEATDPKETQETVETAGEQKKSNDTVQSLLDKCMPYIIDEEGNNTSINSKPLYKLESVAEILNNDSKRTLEKLSKEYGINFNDSSIPEEITEEPAEEIPVTFSESETELEEEPLNEEKDNGSPAIRTISDIDISDSPFYNIESDTSLTDNTVTFTPITENGEGDTKISVSSHTKSIDLTGELLKVSDVSVPTAESVQLEESEFDEYVPETEFTDSDSGKKILKKFANNKKSSFFQMWGSIILTLLVAFFEFPFMSNFIFKNTAGCIITTSVFTLLTVVLNYDIFPSVIKIFTKKSDASIPAVFTVVAVCSYVIFQIVTGKYIIDTLHTLILLSIILSFKATSRFMKASAMLRSFKQINKTTQKNAVTLINDPAITLAMTRGAVEGDSLIAAPKGTTKISDFMKYSTFGSFLGGKASIIAIVSLVISVIAGILSAIYYGDAVYGFYSAAAINCLAALPCLFFIDTLPLYTVSKKTARVGAMIAGKAGAMAIEEANAIVLNSKDIFPNGTVTLHRMEVLSENNLEDTILRAASLTDALQSPLAPIFKKIAGTGNITVFPDSDTVKYEENLGISGWVDNRLLFIGNRTLMESHGISVPNVEIDRKILRQGYFPVYVASQNKACALLVVQYDVEPRVAKELRKLTSAGVTVLVKTSDPNLTEAMICDYLGLYEDSVKVMSAAGCHIYVNTVTPAKEVSAPAAFKTSPLALPTIINSAIRFKNSNTLLTAAYIITSVFGVLFFTYTSFGGSGSLLSDSALLIYSLVSTVLSYLLYLIQKP